jgi:hypothetical protein
MSSVVIAGNTSGTITLDAPNVAGSTVLTLPTVNGTFITSADFDKSLATSGYQRLPSGLIIQWGKTAFNIGQDGTITGTFAFTFPTACLTFHPTSFSDVTSGDGRLRGAFQTSSATTTGFTVTSRNNVNSGGLIGNLNWMAIGY